MRSDLRRAVNNDARAEDDNQIMSHSVLDSRNWVDSTDALLPRLTRNADGGAGRSTAGAQ